jgi:hypothetical protein
VTNTRTVILLLLAESADCWDIGAAGPARREYSLTDAGMDALSKAVAGLYAQRDILDRLIARHERMT